MTGFESIQETFDKSWRRSPMRGAVLAVKVEEALKGLLPPEVQMVSFKEGRLILNVPSASYASDIYLRSREIKKKINESLKSKVVSEIRFRNQS